MHALEKLVSLRLLQDTNERFDRCIVCMFPLPRTRIENQRRAFEIVDGFVSLLEFQGILRNKGLGFMQLLADIKAL